LDIRSIIFAGSTSIRAVLHVRPISGPLLTPFKFTVTADTDFGSEAVLNLGFHCYLLINKVSKGPAPDPSKEENTKWVENVEEIHEFRVRLGFNNYGEAYQGITSRSSQSTPV